MKLTEQVEDILITVPETRNSDITLMIEVWKKFYPGKVHAITPGHEQVWLNDLYYLPREDNIKRIRAKFNAEGQHLPTDPEIAKKRGIEEDRWREEMGYPTISETKHPTKTPSYTQQQAYKTYYFKNGSITVYHYADGHFFCSSCQKIDCLHCASVRNELSKEKKKPDTLPI